MYHFIIFAPAVLSVLSIYNGRNTSLHQTLWYYETNDSEKKKGFIQMHTFVFRVYSSTKHYDCCKYRYWLSVLEWTIMGTSHDGSFQCINQTRWSRDGRVQPTSVLAALFAARGKHMSGLTRLWLWYRHDGTKTDVLREFNPSCYKYRCEHKTTLEGTRLTILSMECEHDHLYMHLQGCFQMSMHRTLLKTMFSFLQKGK